MEETEKLKCLKALRLFRRLPESQLAALGEFLKPVPLRDGDKIFTEGTGGESLYFVSSGRVRISKRADKGASKDLATLGPGDCFGEMALLDTVPRSASASAAGPGLIFELHRDDLRRWLRSHPDLAVEFFSDLVQVQAQRLRRTSHELALLYDLAVLLSDHSLAKKGLLAEILKHVTPRLEGNWFSAAVLFSASEKKPALAASYGELDFSALSDKLPPASQVQNEWLDARTFHAALPAKGRAAGCLIFRAQNEPDALERGEIARTLTAVARLVSPVVVDRR